MAPERGLGMKALIFLGAPGAGKGTQAREVSKAFSIPQVSTGDILREAARKQAPMGLAAKADMEAGALVPDEVVCGIVEERIVAGVLCGIGFQTHGRVLVVRFLLEVTDHFRSDMLEFRSLSCETRWVLVLTDGRCFAVLGPMDGFVDLTEY